MTPPTVATTPRVSFVVLNWHNEAATCACVQSIERQAGGLATEIIVVDNDSTAASRSALADAPGSLVCLAGNRGFTGGMNAGARKARGEFIALLNNDLRLADDWLQTALTAASDPRVGIVGGRSLSDQAGGTESTLPRIDPRGFSQLLAVDAPRAAVASVDGGHLLVRTATWRELGGFDDDFFAYYEELDLCARALARGWQVIYEPGMRVWHRRGLSSDRVRWRRIFWARRNRTIWLAKHFPANEWRRVVIAATLEYLAQALRGSGGPRGSWRGHVAFRAASLAAAAWVLSHPRWLAAKRRATIAAGQHDSGYRRRLNDLYEPFPFSRAILAVPSRR